MISLYKQILKENKITGKQMAVKLGITYGSYRSMTRNKRSQYPKWVLAFIVAYNLKNKE